MYSDPEVDLCGRCGCSCYGNAFLCDGWQIAHPCSHCGCGRREAWLIQEQRRQTELKEAQRAGAEPPHPPLDGVKDGTPMAKQRQMPAPSGRSKGNGYSGGALPPPEGGNFSGNPFFNASLLKKGKNKIQFLGKVRDAGPNSFQDLQAEVKFNGKLYDFGIKLSSGNYRRLFEAFGPNPTKWKGTVLAEKGEYLGKEYVKIVD